MGDEVLARLAALVGVMNAGVDERLLDPVAVDRKRGVVGVLLDDGEQIAEQFAFERRQLGTVDQRPRRGIADAVDLRARTDDRAGRPRGAICSIGVAAPGLARGSARPRLTSADPAQPLRGGFALLRYRLPSSYRFA
jgi:hypothetical protein